MKITGFIWLDDIVEKAETKRHVEQDKVRKLLADEPQFRRVENGHRPGEYLYIVTQRR